MQITVLGASGKVGRLVVAEALARGHRVVAMVHQHNPFDAQDNLVVQAGDVHSGHQVAACLHGSQAVICSLGSWGTASKDIVASGTRQAIVAMHALGVSRIVSLTGADAYAAGDQRPVPLLRRLSHLAAQATAGKILRDGEAHIRLLAASHLDWTVLRSPVMTNGSDRLYRLTLRPGTPWQTISRRAVAKGLLDQLEEPGYLGAAPFIYRQ